MENMLRSTIAITMIEGSTKTNVISPRATAELDCRLLPGVDADLFIATLRDVIDDPGIEIETILRFDTSESPRDTALWRAIEEAVRRRDPDGIVIPSVLAGFTDSHYFRERGIVAYGWSPVVMGPDAGPAHGVDERLSIEAVRQAPRLLYEVLELLAAKR
jgi:acetylornithine deacetylase/succinyl-diaminopimelate desuccinylase-like protein